MFTNFKKFETWNDNTIDKSIFASGRAKHNPKVIQKTIEYKTDNGEYFAKIKQLASGRFLCKIYKIKDGSKIRIKKKIKDTLQTAHNFTREILNDRIDDKKTKKKKSKKKKEEDPLDNLFIDMEEPQPNFNEPSSFDFPTPKEKKKSIIRRFT